MVVSRSYLKNGISSLGLFYRLRMYINLGSVLKILHSLLVGLKMHAHFLDLAKNSYCS